MLGDDWNQVTISRLEAKEEIDDDLLSQISAALKIPVEAIKNFDEEAAIVNIQNNYEGAVLNQSAQYNHQPIFNPLEKYIEAVEKIEKLYRELLEAKEHQIKLMERMANN